MTTQADRIRRFVLDHYVAPARAKGRSTITIRAGDVHRSMRLANAMPAVCSAIGSNKFTDIARVTPTNRTGPANGSNACFEFGLDPAPMSAGPTRSPGPSFTQRAIEGIKRVAQQLRPQADELPREVTTAPQDTTTKSDLDFANKIVLISCVKSKLSHPAPARTLYTSTWFRKTRSMVEARGARWFLLSALYGLVAPDTEIAPYDYTLNTVGVAARRNWANKVFTQLLPEIRDERCVVMFAGHRYREFLVEPLQRLGIKVEIPMEHLARGEQLAWLSETE